MISPSSTSAIGPPTAASGEYMSDGCSTDRTGKTSVCDQGYGRTKSHSCNGRSRVQHLSHSRTAPFGPFITDDTTSPATIFSAFDSSNRILFAVKDSCRSFMYHHLFRYNGRTFLQHRRPVQGFPFSTANPPVLLYGLSIGRITSGSQFYTAL